MMKESLYLKAGAPTRCFLQRCQKQFEDKCVRGDDDQYYCSEACAQEGFNHNVVDLVKVVQSR
jgi:hypothetical protein